MVTGETMTSKTITSTLLAAAICFLVGSGITLIRARKCERTILETNQASDVWRKRAMDYAILLQADKSLMLDTVVPGGCGLALISQDGETVYIQGFPCEGYEIEKGLCKKMAEDKVPLAPFCPFYLEKKP